MLAVVSDFDLTVLDNSDLTNPLTLLFGQRERHLPFQTIPRNSPLETVGVPGLTWSDLPGKWIS